MRYRACTHARTPPYSLRSVRCLEACAGLAQHTGLTPSSLFLTGLFTTASLAYLRQSIVGGLLRPMLDVDRVVLYTDRQAIPISYKCGLFLLNLRCVRDSNPPLPSVTMPRLCPAYVLPTPRFCILMRLICPLHVDTLLTCALSCACYCIPFLCVSFGPVFFAPLPSVPFRSVSFHFIPFRFVRSVPLRPFRSVPHCSLVPPLALFHSVPFRFVLIRSPRSVRFGSFCSALFGSAPLHSARFRIFRSARSRPAPARLVPFFLLRLLRSVTSL